MTGYYDRDLRYRVANRSYYEWFDLDPASMPGRHARDIVGTELYEQTRAQMQGVLNGEPQELERTLNDRQGRRRHASVRYLPDDHDGEIRGFYVFVTDVIPQREDQRNADQARDEAELASRSKSELLANMSHEIRTPMNGVLGMLDLLLSTQLDPEQRLHAETAHRSGEIHLTIINDLPDFSAIEAGKLVLEELEFSPVR